jgi:hypothetical protein
VLFLVALLSLTLIPGSDSAKAHAVNEPAIVTDSTTVVSTPHQLFNIPRPYTIAPACSADVDFFHRPPLSKSSPPLALPLADALDVNIPRPYTTTSTCRRGLFDCPPLSKLPPPPASAFSGRARRYNEETASANIVSSRCAFRVEMPGD